MSQIAQYTLDLARQRRFDDDLVRTEAVVRALDRALSETREVKADAAEVFATARRSINSTCDGALAPIRSELAAQPLKRARLSRFAQAVQTLMSQGR